MDGKGVDRLYVFTFLLKSPFLDLDLDLDFFFESGEPASSLYLGLWIL
jgi:hypothetical protein